MGACTVLSHPCLLCCGGTRVRRPVTCSDCRSPLGGELNAKPGAAGTYSTLASFRAECPCPAMDDESLDELVDRSPGPSGRPRLRPASLASGAGELPPPRRPEQGVSLYALPLERSSSSWSGLCF